MKAGLLEQVCWTNRAYLRGPAKGIILRFGGLGGMDMKAGGPDAAELEWADRGGLVVVPFHNPWAWMNPATQTFVDEVVHAVIAREGLDSQIPVVATGGSMGGHASLVYGMFGQCNITGVFANCPPADLVAHYSERPDLPRTMHNAFDSYGDITAVLERHSPVHQVTRLRKVPHLIFHGGKDMAVNKQKHSDVLVKLMRQAGMDVTYREVSEMGHCGPLTWALYREMIDWPLARFA